jgi:hypothetical protein
MTLIRKVLRPRWVVGGLLVLVVGRQLVPVERTNPPVETEIQTSGQIASLLRRACYDCHSNETVWPWYSRVAPTSWFVARHVNHARSHLNFSEWPQFDLEEQEHLFEEMWEEVSEGAMPLRSYLWMHSEARLSEAERDTLLRWMRPESELGER